VAALAVVEDLDAPFFGDTPIQRIDARRIEAFAAHLRKQKGRGRRGGTPLSPKSVRNYLGTLSALLNFAVRKKWLPSSPMSAVDLPSVTSNAPLEELTFLEPDEVARLAASAGEGDYRTLDRTLYVVAAFTGLRQGELRGLRWEHVDFGRSIVHVLENVTRGRRSSPKGKRRRSVPLAQTAAHALLELRSESHWKGPTDPVFACPSTGQAMARAGLMQRYRRALVTAGLSPTVSFRDLRHTLARRWPARACRSGRSRRGWATPTSGQRSSTCTTHPLNAMRRSSRRPSGWVPIRVPN